MLKYRHTNWYINILLFSILLDLLFKYPSSSVSSGSTAQGSQTYLMSSSTQIPYLSIRILHLRLQKALGEYASDLKSCLTGSDSLVFTSISRALSSLLKSSNA